MAATPPQPRRSRLSVTIIARNEQDVLAETLQSVRPIANEIVLLDTGSTDQTPVLAEQLGAVVRRMPWADDFSAARNHLLEQVTGDWILWLDAGERLTPDSVTELRRFLEREADPDKLYWVMVEQPPTDPSAYGEQVAQARLLPNHPQLRFTGRVRETLRPSADSLGLQFDQAPGRIIRHRREHDDERKVRKARRDLRLVDLATAEQRRTSPRLSLAAGEAYTVLGDRAAARAAFRQALEACQRGSTEMLEAYYGLLTTFDGEPNQRDRQLSVCLEALEVYPLDAQLLCAMGTYLQTVNRLDVAARAFQAAFVHGVVHLETWHLCGLAEMAAACWSMTLQLEGHDDEAVAVLQAALERDQGSARARRHLIALHAKHGRTDDALQLADGMPQDAQQRDLLREAIRGACLAAKRQWAPALGHLQSAYLAGCRDPLCLRWLAVALLVGGETESVEPILRQWLDQEPNNLEAQKYLEAIGQAKQTDDVPASEPEPSPHKPRQIRIDAPEPLPDFKPLQRPMPGRMTSGDSNREGNR